MLSPRHAKFRFLLSNNGTSNAAAPNAAGVGTAAGTSTTSVVLKVRTDASKEPPERSAKKRTSV